MPSHYLKQCWHIVDKTLRNIFQLNLIQNPKVSIQKNALRNVVCKISAIFSWPQCADADKDEMIFDQVHFTSTQKEQVLFSSGSHHILIYFFLFFIYTARLLSWDLWWYQVSIKFITPFSMRDTPICCWPESIYFITSTSCIETWIKWPTFRRQHFQMHFLELNLCIWIHISLKCVPKHPFDNKSALAQVKAWHWTCIIWVNGDPVYSLYALSGLNELTLEGLKFILTLSFCFSIVRWYCSRQDILHAMVTKMSMITI